MTLRFHESVEHLLVDLDKVHPWDENPRSGDIETLIQSIEANGFYQPIVVQRETGEILAGNHRYAAVTRLGGTQIPVVYVDVDDVAATRLALADNRTSDLAFYDEEQLFVLLEQMMANDTLVGTGYDRAAYELLLQGRDNDDIVGGIRQGVTPDERLDEYNQLDIRSIILPYEATVYEEVAGRLSDLRRVMDMDTNADVIQALVADAWDRADPMPVEA